MVTGNDAGHTMTMPCSTHARLHARPAPRTPGSMHARLHARPAPCTPASTHARLHARPPPRTPVSMHALLHARAAGANACRPGRNSPRATPPRTHALLTESLPSSPSPFPRSVPPTPPKTPLVARSRIGAAQPEPEQVVRVHACHRQSPGGGSGGGLYGSRQASPRSPRVPLASSSDLGCVFVRSCVRACVC